MDMTYESGDDVLMTHFSDEPGVRTVSQTRNINVSYTASGDIAEIEILDAKKIGMYPITKSETGYSLLPDFSFR